MKYSAAVVGCGRIGCGFDDDPKRKYIATHAGAYNLVEDTKLVALVDSDIEKLKKYGQKFNAGGRYTDYREMLEGEQPDIVSICTWNSTHHEIITESVKSGVKAIFCEKPITDNLETAEAAVRLCEDNKVLLFIDHQRRFDEMHQEVRDYISEGMLGRIQQASFFYTTGIANTGSHMFDLLRFFLGDVEWVSAVESMNKSPNKSDPNLDGVLKFKNGVFCSIHACDVKDYLIFELDILGGGGRIRITNSGFDLDYFKVDESEFFRGYRELLKTDPPIKTDRPRNFMVNGVKHIVKCLDGKDKPLSSGVDGLKALELICAFHESAKKGGERVTLPLKESKVEIKSR